MKPSISASGIVNVM